MIRAGASVHVQTLCCESRYIETHTREGLDSCIVRKGIHAHDYGTVRITTPNYFIKSEARSASVARQAPRIALLHAAQRLQTQ